MFVFGPVETGFAGFRVFPRRVSRVQVFLFLSRAQVNAQLWSKYQNGLFAIFDTNFRSPMQRVLSLGSRNFFFTRRQIVRAISKHRSTKSGDGTTRGNGSWRWRIRGTVNTPMNGNKNLLQPPLTAGRRFSDSGKGHF